MVHMKSFWEKRSAYSCVWRHYLEGPALMLSRAHVQEEQGRTGNRCFYSCSFLVLPVVALHWRLLLESTFLWKEDAVDGLDHRKAEENNRKAFSTDPTGNSNIEIKQFCFRKELRWIHSVVLGSLFAPGWKREAEFLTFQKDGRVSFPARMPVRMCGFERGARLPLFACLLLWLSPPEWRKTGLQISEQMAPAGD